MSYVDKILFVSQYEPCYFSYRPTIVLYEPRQELNYFYGALKRVIFPNLYDVHVVSYCGATTIKEHLIQWGTDVIQNIYAIDPDVAELEAIRAFNLLANLFKLRKIRTESIQKHYTACMSIALTIDGIDDHLDLHEYELACIDPTIEGDKELNLLVAQIMKELNYDMYKYAYTVF